jgi:hypothetical protein
VNVTRLSFPAVSDRERVIPDHLFISVDEIRERTELFKDSIKLLTSKNHPQPSTPRPTHLIKHHLQLERLVAEIRPSFKQRHPTGTHARPPRVNPHGMTTLGPYRLYQIARYAWHRWLNDMSNRLPRAAAAARLTSSGGGARGNGARAGASAAVMARMHSLDDRIARDSGDDRRSEVWMNSVESVDTQATSPPPPPPPPSSRVGDHNTHSAKHSDREPRSNVSKISRLMADATLFTPGFKPPREIVVLCHGKEFAGSCVDVGGLS